MRFTTSLMLLLCIQLVACGGSGDGGGTGAVVPPAVVVPPVVPPTTPVTPVASPITSRIMANKTIIDQVNNNTASITVQLTDVTRVNLSAGGDTVTLKSNLGSITPVTDLGNGRYTANISVDTHIAALAINATVNGVALVTPLMIAVKVDPAKAISLRAQLGEDIFRDTDLSEPAGQSCATCHDLVGDSSHDSRPANATSAGANNIFGGRNTPTLSYAAQTPDQFLEGNNPVGGQLWDGRAESLEEQARLPFLDDLEMNNASKAAVISKIRNAAYADDFRAVFGATSLDAGNEDAAFVNLSEAIAAFERTSRFSPFTSRWDQEMADGVMDGSIFTQSEMRGFTAFQREGCGVCHFTAPTEGPQMFTTFRFENPGSPRNDDHPFLTDANHPSFDENFIDKALGGAPNNAENGPHATTDLFKPNHSGLFKVPTLRNVAKTAPYMHNGVFNTLEEVIIFYNDNESVPGKDTAENGDNSFERYEFGFTESEKVDLLAFLNALSDE